MPISQKPLSRGEKSLISLCIFAVIPLAAVAYIAGGRDAEPQWNIPATAPRPIPNGYDFYVAAAKATVRFTPEVDPASDTTPVDRSPNSPYALKNYSLARRQQWLKANASTFALVNKGLTTPSMAPDTAGTISPDWSKLRQLARDMSARTRTFQLANQPAEATMSALDTIQMGQDTTRGGTLLGRLVGVAIMALGRDPLEDWDKTINSLNANEARAAARRLEAIISHDETPTQTFTDYKRTALTELRQVFDSPTWRRGASGQTPSGLRANLSRFWQTQTTSKQTIYDNTSRSLDAQIANAKLPYSQAQKAPLPADVDIYTNYVVGGGSAVGNRFIMNGARHTTSLNILLLRLALRAYIAEKGTAPPALSALVPSYLKSIPTDVYSDGKPLFYKPQGKTYKLWSVGPDGINNGGVPLAKKPGAKTIRPVQNILDNKGDYVAGLCR